MKIKARDILMQIMMTFKWICPMTMTKKPCPQKPQCSHQKRIIQPTVNSSVTVVVPLMAHQTNHDHHPNTDQAWRPPRPLIDNQPPMPHQTNHDHHPSMDQTWRPPRPPIDNQPPIDNLPPPIDNLPRLIDNLEGRQMINQIIRRHPEK